MNTNITSTLRWPLVWGYIGILAFILACASIGLGSESDAALAKLNSDEALLRLVQGVVEVQDAGGAWIPAGQETILKQGGHLRTANLSEAKLLFPDGSSVTLGANTDISVDQLNVQREEKIRTIVLSQSGGEATHDVAKWNTEGSTYQVLTPNGSGEARGTQFVVSVTSLQTVSFQVEEGEVAVTGFQQTVIVGAGQVTVITTTQPPSQPADFVEVEGIITQMGNTWIIGGQSIQLISATLFDGDLEVGDVVLVQGHRDDDDHIIADIIILLQDFPSSQFTLTAAVQEISENAWIIAGQTVQLSDSTFVDNTLVIGDIARVEGLILENGDLQAVRITAVPEEGTLPFDFTGVVESIAPESWTVSGLTVKITENTLLEEGLVVGDTVRVSGKILEDSTWEASRIVRALQGDSAFELTGELEDKDPWTVAGITFETREWTQIEDGIGTGDLVRVQGRILEDGTWLAYSIELIEEDEGTNPIIILIGRVISIDPWVVNGFPLNVTDDTDIQGTITPGMIVRVEILLLPDGTWQVLSIAPLDDFAEIPGCTTVVATVVTVNGNEVQFLGWPSVTLGEDVTIESESAGTLSANQVVLVVVCTSEGGQIVIVQIIIVNVDDIGTPGEGGGEKVLVCHKPGKNAHTLSISASAVPAHLGHGDTLGPCP
ncbi:MAG TPA: DUF5666 domain-containing protein [Anaerolineales bacterium]|nr:DUF5666 domain-containing protein [Anaerolineales bacterium]